MRHHQGPSPLPPDPAGREDIMSDEPREEEAGFCDEKVSPWPHDAGREGARREDQRGPVVIDR